MAAPRTITSANAILMLSIPGIFDTPVAIQGFAADAAFDVDSVPTAETAMGVDGKMSAGFIFSLYKQKIHLQADSESVDVFDIWDEAQRSEKDIFFAAAQVTMKSTGKIYTFTKGVLSNYKPLPDAKKKLEPQDFEITWESVSKAEA